MPSFATLFIAATAALAAFASAAPVTDTNGVTGPLDNAGNVITNSLGGATNVGDVAGQRRGSPVDQIKETIVNGATGGQQLNGAVAPADVATPTKRDGPRSLPDILILLQVRLVAINERLHRIIDADVKVEAKVFVHILEELCAVIGEVVIDIKALAGLSIEIVLALKGRVITIVEAADLVVVVLTTIYAILAIVIEAVVKVEGEVHIALSAVARVIVELLAAIFICVDSLLPVLCPKIETIISLTRVWGFAGVLAILKV